MALFDLFPRSASVLATAPCTAIELSTASLHQLFDEPILGAVLAPVSHESLSREHSSRRLRISNERLFRAFLGDLDYKLLET